MISFESVVIAELCVNISLKWWRILKLTLNYGPNPNLNCTLDATTSQLFIPWVKNWRNLTRIHILILAKHEVNSVGSVPFPVNEHDNMMNNDHCISQVCCDNLDKLIFEFRNHIYGGFFYKTRLNGPLPFMISKCFKCCWNQ